jgi:putative membrane protein
VTSNAVETSDSQGKAGPRRPGRRNTVMTSVWNRLIVAIVAFGLASPLVTARAEQSAAAPTDSEIAAIVVAANQVDMDAGTLAKSKAQSTEVRALAERMVIDHTGVNEQASALVGRLKVTPKSNATSEGLTKGGDENLAKLRGLSGAAFDKAYVMNEVTYHQTVIDALDKTLIPNARNADLRELLVKVRPAFVSHLEHARHLQSKLDGASATTTKQ